MYSHLIRSLLGAPVQTTDFSNGSEPDVQDMPISNRRLAWRSLFPAVNAAARGRTTPEEPEPQAKIEPTPDEKLRDLYEEYKHLFPFEPEGETGAERVKVMYKAFFTGFSMESKTILEIATVGTMAGFVYGSTQNSREIVQDFIRKFNDATFEGEFHARRKFRDVLVIRTTANGAMMAWRCALFPSLFAMSVLTSFAYRNYVQPLDFALSGALVGGLWKFKQGPKAMFAGATVAAFLGLISGILTYGAMKLAGITVPEYRYWKASRILKEESDTRKLKASQNKNDDNRPRDEAEELLYLRDKRRDLLKQFAQEDAELEASRKVNEVSTPETITAQSTASNQDKDNVVKSKS